MTSARAAALLLVGALTGCSSGDVHLEADNGALRGVEQLVGLATSLHDASGSYPGLTELATAGLVTGDDVVVGMLGDANDPAPCYEVVVGTERASWDRDDEPRFVAGSSCQERT